MALRSFVLVTLLILAGCASKTVTQKSQQELEEQLAKQVGSAKKNDLIASYGEADWCQQSPGGAETCRFSRTVGEKWIGPKKFQKRASLKDEVLAEFAPDGTLRSFRVNSQR